jgi:hypothetical protein
MTAAEKVTEIGRKVLTCMIAAIEDVGGIVVEADTDGIIVCYRNTDPQAILQAVTAAIPKSSRLRWSGRKRLSSSATTKTMSCLTPMAIVTVKGSKWRGRDKEAYQRKQSRLLCVFAKQVVGDSHRVGKGQRSRV